MLQFVLSEDGVMWEYYEFPWNVGKMNNYSKYGWDFVCIYVQDNLSMCVMRHVIDRPS